MGEFKNRPNLVSDIVTASPVDVPAKIGEMIKKWIQGGSRRTDRAAIFKQCLDNDIIPIVIKADN